MNRPEDQVLVIFGASGDLTKRMLMPSLYELHVRQMLPERFVILGTSRKSMSDEEFRLSIRLMLEELKGEKDWTGKRWIVSCRKCSTNLLIPWEVLTSWENG